MVLGPKVRQTFSMMMIKRLVFSLICMFFVLTGKGQDTSLAMPSKNDGFFLVFQLGYNRGAGTIKFTDEVSLRNTGYMASARVTAGYFIHPTTSLGLSFGLDGYHEPDFNLFPVSADVRYYLKPDKKTVFCNADVGYSMKAGTAFKSGALGDVAIGYRMNAGKRVNVLLSTGVNYQRIENANTFIINYGTGTIDYVQSSFWIRSFAFNVGFLF